MKGCDYMKKFNKDKFEVFMGWLFTLIIIINTICPVAGVITGELLISKNYFSLIFILFSILSSAYMLTVAVVSKKKLKRY